MKKKNEGKKIHLRMFQRMNPYNILSYMSGYGA